MKGFLISTMMVVIALLFTSIAARPAWDRDELEAALLGAGAGAVDAVPLIALGR